MTWEVVIGLETHAQLTTASKIFSGASTEFGKPANTQASAVDLALPGTLPVLNRGAVERAIRFGLAVGGTIAAKSVFARKNYFYPDLPKGYQISQYELPVVSGGRVAFLLGSEERSVSLTRAHLEEDAGKSLHEDPRFRHSGAGFHGMTGIDLNRAGTPLLEIVSEPDMRSAAEAVAYARALHSLVRWIGICDGNMQEGSFRCDANVSVRRLGAPLGTRCEIKNLNSFRFMEKAIEYEVRRQVELIEDGGTVVQETRLYDPDRGETRPMRSKEDAQDYRYFPDPDLLPLQISQQWVDEVSRSMPKLPAQKREEYLQQHQLPESHIQWLISDVANTQFFDAVVSEVNARGWRDGGVLQAASNFMTGDLAAHLNADGIGIGESKVSPRQLAELIHLSFDDKLSAGKVQITNRAAKEVFSEMWRTGGSPAEIVARRGLAQMSDNAAIEAAVDQVLAANAKQVEDYRAGKEKAFNSLVGQVMKATQGKANPAQVNEILRRKLGG